MSSLLRLLNSPFYSREWVGMPAPAGGDCLETLLEPDELRPHRGHLPPQSGHLPATISCAR
jgi:hypothetical protein